MLIVEDEAIIGDNLASTLATQLASPLASPLASGRVPGLTPIDLRVKGSKGSMDRIETAPVLRERRDIPVVYLTADSSRQTIDRANVTGVSGFRAKPIQCSAPGSGDRQTSSGRGARPRLGAMGTVRGSLKNRRKNAAQARLPLAPFFRDELLIEHCERGGARWFSTPSERAPRRQVSFVLLRSGGAGPARCASKNRH
jgi:CheY-like chemotaxis protein